MDDILDDAKFMLWLSKEIGKEWMDLGRLLSVKDSELYVIDDEQKCLGEKVYRMLCQWRDQQRFPTLDILTSGLHHLKRIDLIKKIETKTSTTFLVY